MSPASENSTVAITKFFKAEQASIETLGPEGKLLYASVRGNSTVFEGFDEEGNVVMTQSLSDIKQMLKA